MSTKDVLGRRGAWEPESEVQTASAHNHVDAGRHLEELGPASFGAYR